MRLHCPIYQSHAMLVDEVMSQFMCQSKSSLGAVHPIATGDV